MKARYIDPALLRRLLRYDPETGKLFWRKRPLEYFNSPRACAVWNGRYAGHEAMTCIVNGYRSGRLFDRSVRAHRVIWALVHGEWPDQVDHINGDRQDNRLHNLRSVSRTENNRNARCPKNNKSGVVGVFWERRTGRWHAYIGKDRRRHHLGSFSQRETAVAARRAAEQRLGYHPNHGRRA